MIMCGIIGYTGKNEASEILFNSLTALEYRGYDSAGVAVIDANKSINTVKTISRVQSLVPLSQNGEKIQGKTGIGHTRWATHGAPDVKNAHPHLSEKFAVVHNGIIENYGLLKKELIKDGFVFKSETDTEVVPFLLEKNYNGEFLESVRKTACQLTGSFALVILCKDEPDTLIAVKRFSPLIIGFGETGNFAASDITAVSNYTQRVAYLDDGEMAVIKPDSIKVYSIEGKPVCKEIKTVSSESLSVDKNGYEHFMLKEIYEQPQAFTKTAEHYLKKGNLSFEASGLEEVTQKIEKIHIVACGSAYHAGLSAKYVFEEVAGIEVNVEIASEYRYSSPFVSDKTLVIAVSQSGETADTIAALKLAKEKGAYTAAVVNVKNSTISRMCHSVFYTFAGPEIAVATTKGYTTQLCVLSLFALYIARKRNRIDNEQLHKFIEEIRYVPLKMTELLYRAEDIKNLAYQTLISSSVFFIGRNTDYAISQEASLKLKEISYIHSESYAAGELKHGTISLIEEGTTVFAVCCNKDLESKMISNIKEVRARGAFVISIAQEGDKNVGEISDKIFYAPCTSRLFSPIVHIVFFQLFSYYTALKNGCDIDKPRNLAKSVTVE